MKGNLRLHCAFLLLVLLTAFSCDDEQGFAPKQGQASFSISSEASPNGREQLTEIPAFVFLSVETTSGTSVMKNVKLPLVSFGQGFVTESISLPTGSYKLVSFLVLNESLKTIYATPKQGSEKAHLVDDPLPIHFNVGENEASEVRPQVLTVSDLDEPSSFGYSSFSFDVVDVPETMNVRVKVELKVGDVTYLDVATKVKVSAHNEANVLQWSHEYDYDGPWDNDFSVKAGFYNYSFEVNHFGASIKQVIRGEYLLESSLQEVPVTYVLTGFATAKKLSHYITYQTDGSNIFTPQSKVTYSYNHNGSPDKMTFFAYSDSLGTFVPQRYFTFSYENNRLKKLSGFHADSEQYYVEDIYEYHADGSVSKISEHNYGAGINAEVALSYNYTNRVIDASYTFSNGGAFQYQMILPHGSMTSDRTNRGAQLCSTGTYVNDKNINPFKHLGYTDFLLRNYSLNNRTSESVTYSGCAFPTLVPEQYEYQYDPTGYPITSVTNYRNTDFKMKTEYFYQ